jgi:hypothetical protein
MILLSLSVCCNVDCHRTGIIRDSGVVCHSNTP